MTNPMRRSSRRRPPAFEPLEPRALLAVAPLPVVSIADASVTEGDSGTKTLAFAVTLSSPATSRTTVRYATADGTATASGGDYSAASGVVTFTRGSSRATVSVTVRGDGAVEADETFRVTLASPSGCTLGRSIAAGTILNDDAPPAPGSWTILVYMTGEDLNRFARADINEMEKALTGLPTGVRFVVGWDQPKSRVGPAYATGGGTQPAWRTFGRSVLKADANMATVASTFDLSLGERNTGDPATLVDFVKWGVAQAPASRYVLQMWGHGGGLDGSQFDSESGDDPLTIGEMAAALGASGMPTFDVVSYDNCLMAMAEVGAALAPKVGGVFVASEETIEGTGQDYATAFAALAVADPSRVTAAQVAAGMVQSYGTQYVDGSNPSDTFSATVAAGYADLTAAVRTFVTAAAGLSSADRPAVLAAASGTVAYDEPAFRDLGGFMTAVASSPSLPATLTAAAGGVRTALSSIVAARTSDSRSSSGLSIYLPTSFDAYLSSYKTDAAAFCAATGWDAFARWLATGSRSAVAIAGVTGAVRAHGRRMAIDPAAFAALAADGRAPAAPRRGGRAAWPAA